MKLAMFRLGADERLGAFDGEHVIDLAEEAPHLPRDITAIIRSGPSALDAVVRAVRNARPSARHEASSLSLLPPISNPGKIACLGLNYVDHAKEGGHAKPDYPSFFLRCATSLVAHGEPILRPLVSTQLDYEAELVAVVGRTARHVSRSDALAHIVGYSCFNDGSVRDYQRKTAQWTIGKNFDKTGAFGPCFVTADELPLGCVGLSIQSRLNGQVMQSANTSDMIFPVDQTVAMLSECMTLEPGDLIVMGTPSGVGHARKPPVWMKRGDVIEVEIEKVGLLRNPIEDERARK
jgi:acylpyruvate hydrolase